jgi:hypothetical protein
MKTNVNMNVISTCSERRTRNVQLLFHQKSEIPGLGDQGTGPGRYAAPDFWGVATGPPDRFRTATAA